MPPIAYVDLLRTELSVRSQNVPRAAVRSIYFGGGTPSLFDPSLILAILQELANTGFTASSNTEITIEIDPATIDNQRLRAYMDSGVNRFSVGVQSFNDRLLKAVGRQHTRQQAIELLQILNEMNANYSFDLLFALPTQSLAELRDDVARTLDFNPPHVSRYCLTLPADHPLQKGRAPEEEQVDMFHLIDESFESEGIRQYELSNYARPGYESQHNLLYWTDQPYWGLGVSAHSYFPANFSNHLDVAAPWGMRFWNSAALKAYQSQIESPRHVAPIEPWDFTRDLPGNQIEILTRNQALTDFCHTSLRLIRGLDDNALRLKFGDEASNEVQNRLAQLNTWQLMDKTPMGWKLSGKGRLLANRAYEELTFIDEDAMK